MLKNDTTPPADDAEAEGRIKSCGEGRTMVLVMLQLYQARRDAGDDVRGAFAAVVSASDAAYRIVGGA
jgi:hypothetical protein